MTMIDNGDLLGRKGHKTDLLQQGRHLINRMEHYETLNRPYQDWMLVIKYMNNPMQLLFGLFDSLLSRQPSKVHKAEEQLSILLHWASLHKYSLKGEESETAQRAIVYFAKNNYSLAKEMRKQVVTDDQIGKDQARYYARLTKRISKAFDNLFLFLPVKARSPLHRVSALWERIAQRTNTPVKLAHWDKTDSPRSTTTKQPEPHVRA